MKIKHDPVIKEIGKVEQHYSEKDNVPVKYVCTTDLFVIDKPVDIFYRDTPHPEFGNRYFALYFVNKDLMICNADIVEGLIFGMVKNDNNQLEYSSYRHDYKSFKNGNMIDGGRDYIRSSCKVHSYVVKDGVMKKVRATKLTKKS
jgi:hypothetical protein